ncbi:LysR substrate-binding domain-containing protein [Marinobacter pelagius]|uniref:LysR family transcriptional regulator n=1 Tax=Marinobacter sp. C7 TaxID=2951363 RepID=UPI001EEFE753|nr:LysR family transcriptional regulator [Marinobacter sp. C7]MCG7200268.1 LysR substrate-binding domain-containing protein [Marinobacter sp. C7]
MDKLWAMQVFARVVECGSFSRAAESLDIANATVTSSVRNLESYLGVTLLSRNTRTLRLTDEGERFFEHCTDLLRRVEEAEASVRDQKTSVQGQLKIEAPVGFGKAVIVPRLAAFSKAYPELSIALRLTDHPEGLIESGTDVAIRIDSVSDADLVARPLYQAHYVACASPALLESIDVPGHPSELDPKLCLGIFGHTRFSPRKWLFEQADERVEIEPDGRMHFNSSDALIQAALEDQGIIFVLDVFVNKLISSGQLVDLFPDWSTNGRTFFSVTPQSRFVAPRTRAFIDFMMSTLDSERRPSVATQIKLRPGRDG